ncbi:ABC transporter ATP-binding protein [Garciella nitratireducens]|uniref:ABC-2 type transport system ATP-binding protein n=1 Tax=Garciella nitratireducens DSM 15102 TaxID=1121911 RepID=A0A1T4MB27_9FIRM|nr:ABC transporter ATP-binding protein [Garciella nitratireducens]SJZ64250.1 ABC-2 type transport system ATP-binding protein [Garciella nitratireducens DSM 15102]
MLEVNHLHFSYGTNVVFDNFSFSINKGEILCIVGKNGSGKTTLLKVLCGLNYCPTLECKIDDTPISQNDLKKYVTYIPASPNFYESLTSEEYILWLKSLWKKDEKYKEKVYDYMRLLQLEVNKNSEIATFSLGMKYKLYFCSFLALDNPILLLDEPLNSLDIASRELAISLLKQYIQEHNGYCLFSSHVKDTISNLATKTISI